MINSASKIAIRQEYEQISMKDAKLSLIELKSSLTRRIERKHYEFLEDIRENFDCKFSFDRISLFSISFLHELGHIYYHYRENDLDFNADKLSRKDYYRLKRERLATNFAVNYINRHGFDVMKWQARLQKAYDLVSKSEFEKFVNS